MGTSTEKSRRYSLATRALTLFAFVAALALVFRELMYWLRGDVLASIIIVLIPLLFFVRLFAGSRDGTNA